MAEGSRRYLSYVREYAWDAAPATPSMKTLRNTGGSGFSVGRNAMVSAEFRSDRMIPGVRMGNNKTALSVPIEFSSDSYDDLLESLLFGRWVPATGANDIALGATTLAVAAAGKTFTRSAGSFVTDGFLVGDYIIVSGCTNAANNGVFVVAAVAALVLTVNAAHTLVDEAAAAGRTIGRWGGLPINLGATTCAVDSAAKTFTRSAGSFITDGLAVGDYIKTSNFTNGGNNGSFKVSALTATVATCATAVGLVTEAAAANRSYQSTRMILKAGTTQVAFRIEEGFSDVGKYRVGEGMVVNSLSLSIKPASAVTGQFELVGAAAAAFNAVSLGAPAAAPSTQFFDSFNGSLKEGGSLLATVTGLEFSHDNGLDAKPALFSRDPKRVAAGRANTTVNVSAFFLDSSLADKFLNETATSLEFTLIDPAGNQYNFYIPTAKYTGHGLEISENDIVQTLPLQALYDSTLGSSIRITKTPA